MGENLLHPNAIPAPRPDGPRIDRRPRRGRAARADPRLLGGRRGAPAGGRAGDRGRGLVRDPAAPRRSRSAAGSGANRLRTLVNVGRLAPGEERWPEAELWSLERLPHVPGMLEAGRTYVVELADPAIPDSERDVLEATRQDLVPARADRLRRRDVGHASRRSPTPARSPFTIDDAPFVEALATQVAVAIGRAELFSTVAALAYEDPLTGLANRRALEERLEAAVDDAAVVPQRAGAAVLRPRRAQGDQRRRRPRGRRRRARARRRRADGGRRAAYDGRVHQPHRR